MKKILIFFILISLTSCGYHLRGAVQLAPPLQNLYLKTPDPYGSLARNLKQYLKFAGVHLTQEISEATTVLVILGETTSQQLLGISGTQQTRQYNLILTVTFNVTRPNGNPLIPPQTLSQSRTLTIKADQILAGSNEASILYQQMRQAILYDMLSRLASKDITALLLKNSP